MPEQNMLERVDLQLVRVDSLSDTVFPFDSAAELTAIGAGQANADNAISPGQVDANDTAIGLPLQVGLEGGSLLNRLQVFQNLKDVALRKRLETSWGLYMAESWEVIKRAISAGHRPYALLVAERWQDQFQVITEALAGAAATASAKLPSAASVIRPKLPASRSELSDEARETVPYFVAPLPVLEEVAGFNVHRGALAAFYRPAPLPVPELLDSLPVNARIVVLENLVNHTNVGAVFRSAAALGLDAVVLSPSCADPLYRRAVRVSMGATLHIPWARAETWPNFDELRNAGFRIIATSPKPGSADIRDLKQLVDLQHDRLALLVGSEGPGLTHRALQNADFSVRIPMFHEMDSLNVAAAATLAVWEIQREAI